jgi:hypothetical protein
MLSVPGALFTSPVPTEWRCCLNKRPFGPGWMAIVNEDLEDTGGPASFGCCMGVSHADHALVGSEREYDGRMAAFPGHCPTWTGITSQRSGPLGSRRLHGTSWSIHAQMHSGDEFS